VCNKDDDTFSLRVSFCPKEADQCAAYIALHVMDRRDDSQHCCHYLPCQLFSTQQPSATLEEVLQLSTLLQPRSPFLLNDSLLVVAHLSTEPISFEQAAGQMQENPFNFSSGTNSIRAYSGSGDGDSSRAQPTPSPFASMFTGDLTRFLSGTAFAEVRLGALGADPSARNYLPCHASRLTRVSEVLRLHLGPLLKTLPARPLGYGGPEAQPLVLLDAPLSVLRVFHQMLYQGSVSVPAAVLAGLLQLAVLYDMPELELWILQQSAAAKQKLAPGSGAPPNCHSSMVEIYQQTIIGAPVLRACCMFRVLGLWDCNCMQSSSLLVTTHAKAAPETVISPVSKATLLEKLLSPLWPTQPGAGATKSRKQHPDILASFTVAYCLHIPGRGSGKLQVVPPQLPEVTSPVSPASHSSSITSPRQGTIGSAMPVSAWSSSGRASSSSGMADPAPAAAGVQAVVSPEPERRSCGRDRFQQARTLYELSMSSLDLEQQNQRYDQQQQQQQPAATGMAARPSSSSSGNGSSRAEAPIMLRSSSSLTDQLDFWRKQQQLVEQESRLQSKLSRSDSIGSCKSTTSTGTTTSTSGYVVPKWLPPPAEPCAAAHACDSSNPDAALSEAKTVAVERKKHWQKLSAGGSPAAASHSSSRGTLSYRPSSAAGTAAAADAVVGVPPISHVPRPAAMADTASSVEAMATAVLGRGTQQQQARPVAGSSSTQTAVAPVSQLPSSGSAGSWSAARQDTQQGFAGPGSDSAASFGGSSSLAFSHLDTASELAQMAAAVLQKSPAAAASAAPSQLSSVRSSTRPVPAAGSAAPAAFAAGTNAAQAGLGRYSEVEALAASILKRAPSSSGISSSLNQTCATAEGPSSTASSSGTAPPRPAAAAAAAAPAAGGVARPHQMPGGSNIWYDPAAELADMASAVLRNKGSNAALVAARGVQLPGNAAESSGLGSGSQQAARPDSVRHLAANQQPGAASNSSSSSAGARGQEAAELAQKLLQQARGGAAASQQYDSLLDAHRDSHAIAVRPGGVGVKPAAAAAHRAGATAAAASGLLVSAAAAAAPMPQSAGPASPDSCPVLTAAVSPTSPCGKDDAGYAVAASCVSGSPLSCRSDGSSSGASSSRNSMQQSDASSCPTAAFDFFHPAEHRHQTSGVAGNAAAVAATAAAVAATAAAVAAAAAEEQQCEADAAIDAVGCAREQEQRELQAAAAAAEAARLAQKQHQQELEAAAAEAARLAEEQRQRELAAMAAEAEAARLAEERRQQELAAAAAAAAAKAARLAEEQRQRELEAARLAEEQRQRELAAAAAAAEAARLAEEQRQKELAAAAAEAEAARLAEEQRQQELEAAAAAAAAAARLTEEQRCAVDAAKLAEEQQRVAAEVEAVSSPQQQQQDEQHKPVAETEAACAAATQAGAISHAAEGPHPSVTNEDPIQGRKAAMAAAAAEAARLAQQYPIPPKLSGLQQQQQQPQGAAAAVRLAEQQRQARLQQQKEAAERAAEQQRQQLPHRSLSPISPSVVGGPTPGKSSICQPEGEPLRLTPPQPLQQQQRVRVAAPAFATSKPSARVVKPFVQPQQLAPPEHLQYSRLVKRSPGGSTAGSSRAGSENGSENGSHSSTTCSLDDVGAAQPPTSAAGAASTASTAAVGTAAVSPFAPGNAGINSSSSNGSSGSTPTAGAAEASAGGKGAAEDLEHSHSGSGSSSSSSSGLLGKLKRLSRHENSLDKVSFESNSSTSGSGHSNTSLPPLTPTPPAPAAGAAGTPDAAPSAHSSSTVLRQAQAATLQQQQRALAAAEVAAAAAVATAAASPSKPPLAPNRSVEPPPATRVLSGGSGSRETTEARLAREAEERQKALDFRRAELERLKQAQQDRAAQDAAIAERLRQQQQQQLPSAAANTPAKSKQKEAKKKRWW